jgi:hypothetical protein
MANYNTDTGKWTPGTTYVLKTKMDDQELIFYVGETIDPDRRFKEHQYAGKNATAASTLVYRTIQALEEGGYKWWMEERQAYGEEGPEELEDELIMECLYDGHSLANEKKGNAAWLVNKEIQAKEMQVRGIRSYKQFKAVIALEEAQRIADLKHAEWMREQEFISSLDPHRVVAVDIFNHMFEYTKTQAEINEAARKKYMIKEERLALEIRQIRNMQERVWEETGEMIDAKVAKQLIKMLEKDK